MAEHAIFARRSVLSFVQALPARKPARRQRSHATRLPSAMNLPLVILIPVFNEWDLLGTLLERIDAALAEAHLCGDVVLLDDGSTTSHEQRLHLRAMSAVGSVEILRLARNLGHQRAISIGLAWASENRPGRTVAILDGDGEDNPADIAKLVARYEGEGGDKIVFAARTRRMERWQFQVCYRVYQFVHLLLTGHRVRVGNFSIVPPAAVQQLAVISETWNHYAAAVFNSRIPYVMVPTPRDRRLGGRSRMNFTALVVHGLSALSVFSHIIGVRLLIVSGALIGLLGAGLAAAWLTCGAAQQLHTPWLLGLLAWLLATLVQAVVLGAAFVLLVLSGRQGTTFIPKRDYRYFVASLTAVSPRPADGPRPLPESQRAATRVVLPGPVGPMVTGGDFSVPQVVHGPSDSRWG
jgi:polyisoprenyl-phosphate glycosyltransferase